MRDLLYKFEGTLSGYSNHIHSFTLVIFRLFRVSIRPFPLHTLQEAQKSFNLRDSCADTCTVLNLAVIMGLMMEAEEASEAFLGLTLSEATPEPKVMLGKSFPSASTSRGDAAFGASLGVLWKDGDLPR